MMVYLLIDENNVVQCVASEECNLHKDKLHLTKVKADYGGVVGDTYDPQMKKWTVNSARVLAKEAEYLRNAMIEKKMREMAEAELIKEGLIDA